MFSISYPSITTTISLTPKLCLNMIVKNESRVILRLLQSVANIIDYYCICDTGSTDNTKEIIANFFEEKGIPGKIIEEPFRDFGYNRSFALKACESIPNMDYILLLDADMVLTGPALQDPESFKKSLTADVYHLCQGTATFFYKNVRIVKNYKDFKYWGVTHEYLQTPEGTQYKYIDKNQIFIEDIGDGGAKSDKFERDIRLLQKGLEENPNNDRYTFYLANSLRDAGRTKEAIEMFQKRIDIGGWVEEVWHSYLNIGKCYKSLGEIEKAIATWLNGYQFYPKRIENLYEIIQHYRLHGKNRLAYDFYLIADQSRKEWGPSDDFLFLQKDIYDYKIDYELSIIGYYVNYKNIDLLRTSMKVLDNHHASYDTKHNVLNNYKFYTKKIADYQRSWNDILFLTEYNRRLLENATKSLNIDKENDREFVTSTPSICCRENHLIINVRYVNYRVNEKGEYINRDKIHTRNAIAVIDISKPLWKMLQEFELKYDTKSDGDYVGLEDIRLAINEENEIVYHANRGLSYHNIVVESGKIDLAKESTVDCNFLTIENKSAVEKNWVIIPSNSSNKDEDDEVEHKVIYKWYPNIQIGEIDKTNNNTFMTKHEIPVPSSFQFLRGSTNGILINNEIWFFCHAVSHEDRRYYYHSVVVLDATTYQLKRYTPLFTFEGQKVEYTLGATYIEDLDALLIGYSINDNTTKYMVLQRTYFEEMFIEMS